MKLTATITLFVAFVCWNTNVAESQHNHHHHEHHHHHHHHSDEMLKTSSKNEPLNFAVHLMEDLHHEAGMDENIITSPISIATLLQTVHKGAAGKTKEELATFLGLPKDETKVTEEFTSNSVSLKKILSRPEKLSFSETNLAAGIFVQKNFPIYPDFINEAKKYFPTHVANVDFGESKATDNINGFVSNVTHGRISKLFSSPLDSQTSVVLVSALYFHGVWSENFLSTNTKPEKFYTGIKDVDVQMMAHKNFVPYYDDPLLMFESIQLKYHDDYSMAIILPYKQQTLMNLTHHLSGDDLNKALYETKVQGIKYKIPRMKFSWSKSLKSTFEKEGLHSMFDAADFSKMTPQNLLSVSDIVHAAEIEVDEEGTRASAATAANFATYSLKPTPDENSKEFYVTRPFYLIIFHQPTSVIMFTAFVHQPNGASA